MPKILIVEDDIKLASRLTDWLKHERHTVELAKDGQEAAGYLAMDKFDVIILDIVLPGVSGIDVCRQFRSRGGTTPILMLTGKTEIQDKTLGLDSGADDYLTKPFDAQELSARIRALLRRSTHLTENVLVVGRLSLDIASHRLLVDNKEVPLLPKEYSILEFLMRRPNHVFSPDDLLRRVWESDSEATITSLRQYIYQLRKKLSAFGIESIATVHGVGYRLEA
ncbi:MAG: DNA-binding response regulator [Candidatus Melainabacteria bacterium]|nr:MAG: DNA-binding response regulator [Candidatus Melainabacteria bacterium]